MNTRYRQRQVNRSSQRRTSSANSLTFGRFITALGGGLVLILLAATFLGDYLRLPTLSASASPSIISPNRDQTQDTTSLNYTISDVADVIINVLSNNGALIRQLNQIEKQPAGQYVVVWDGTDAENQVVADGRYLLEVNAKGNSRSATQSVQVQVDSQAPFLRLTNIEDVARVSDRNLKVEGLTDPDAVIYQAGFTDPIPVDNQGRFQIERQLTEGSNILEVLASDTAGNTARTSHEVILITQPPELTLTTPTIDQWFNRPIIEVNGTAANAASVTINDEPVTLAEDGAFNREVILQEGDNPIRVAVTDDVGNVTTQERLVHLKTTPPDIRLDIDEGTVFNQSTLLLNGRTEPGAIILVNNQLTPVSALGEFQTSLSLVNGTNNIQIEARDIAGNVNTLTRRVTFRSPVARNEMTRFFENLPSISSLATPVLVLVPLLLLFGYFFTRPVGLALSTESDTFTPGLPEESKTLGLTLELSKSARTTIEVLDQYNQVVATVTHRRQRGSGIHSFYWDGYDDRGNVVPSGSYLIQAVASTPGASIRSVVPVTIYEDPLAHNQYRRQIQPVEQERQEVARRNTRRNRR